MPWTRRNLESLLQSRFVTFPITVRVFARVSRAVPSIHPNIQYINTSAPKLVETQRPRQRCIYPFIYHSPKYQGKYQWPFTSKHTAIRVLSLFCSWLPAAAPTARKRPHPKRSEVTSPSFNQKGVPLHYYADTRKNASIPIAESNSMSTLLLSPLRPKTGRTFVVGGGTLSS